MVFHDDLYNILYISYNVCIHRVRNKYYYYQNIKQALFFQAVVYHYPWGAKQIFS